MFCKYSNPEVGRHTVAKTLSQISDRHLIAKLSKSINISCHGLFLSVLGY